MKNVQNFRMRGIPHVRVEKKPMVMVKRRIVL